MPRDVYCLLLAINLLLAFLKATGVPTEKNSIRLIFLAITFVPFFLSVRLTETDHRRRSDDLRLPQTAPPQGGPTQSHPGLISIPLTALYLASNYLGPTSFLWTLAMALILQRWQLPFFSCFKHLICWLADTLRSAPTNDTEPTRPDDDDLEANPQGHAAFRPAPTLNIDNTVQLPATTQLTPPDDADMEGNLQGEDINSM